jgi:hypothetical protein
MNTCSNFGKRFFFDMPDCYAVKAGINSNIVLYSRPGDQILDFMFLCMAPRTAPTFKLIFFTVTSVEKRLRFISYCLAGRWTRYLNLPVLSSLKSQGGVFPINSSFLVTKCVSESAANAGLNCTFRVYVIVSAGSSERK